MKWTVLLVGSALLAAGCGADQDAATRFVAQRELYRANEAFRNASIQPELHGADEWRALADRFESIADRYDVAEGRTTPDPIQAEIQTIAARALFAAAQIHQAQRDTTRASQVLERMSREYAHLPTIAGEVAYARGAVAERSGHALEAAEQYQVVVDRIEPDPLQPGVAGEVLGLPLRIARLRSVANGAGIDRSAYMQARLYYESAVHSNPGTIIEVDARTALAAVAVDLEKWEEANSELRAAEHLLLGMEDPLRDPADVRYYLAGAMQKGQAPADSVRVILESILTDYPQSPVRLHALSSLSEVALSQGKTESALEYLDRIRTDYAGNEAVAAGALLGRARILERDDRRWSESLEAYRALPAEYPVTEAALWAPVEIALHYMRVADDAAVTRALEKAEEDYRNFIRRYPPGPRSLFARERLVQTLLLQDDNEAAVTEMLSLGEDLAKTPRGPAVFIAAAEAAFAGLADTTQAVTILERIGELYAGAEIGKMAIAEAERLRGLRDS